MSERPGDIVAVADEGDSAAANRVECFTDREQIGERLARMRFVGEPIDDRDASAIGQGDDRRVLEDSGDQEIDILADDAAEIVDGFAPAQADFIAREK